LKAIAEFVENSIDARAKNVTIVRGREGGQPYLRVSDDGDGIPRDAEGIPDFRYVATHICDSLKRTLRAKGLQGIQGEFGIGLLSFWTVGERLVLSSAGADGRTYQMEMQRDQPGYTISPRKTLFGHPGTELLVHPLLPGLRSLSGKKSKTTSPPSCATASAPPACASASWTAAPSGSWTCSRASSPAGSSTRWAPWPLRPEK
jgi:hypothetical protein